MTSSKDDEKTWLSPVTRGELVQALLLVRGAMIHLYGYTGLEDSADKNKAAAGYLKADADIHDFINKIGKLGPYA